MLYLFPPFPVPGRLLNIAGVGAVDCEASLLVRGHWGTTRKEMKELEVTAILAAVNRTILCNIKSSQVFTKMVPKIRKVENRCMLF